MLRTMERVGVVDGLTVVIGDDDGPGDVGQTVQPDLDEVGIVVDHEPRLPGEVGILDAPDQHKVREQLAQAGQAGHAVDEHVVGDLAQLREAEHGEVFRLGVVQQVQLQVSIDHGAVVQQGQFVQVVLHVDVAAYFLLVGRGRGLRVMDQKQQQQQHGQQR